MSKTSGAGFAGIGKGSSKVLSGGGLTGGLKNCKLFKFF